MVGPSSRKNACRRINSQSAFTAATAFVETLYYQDNAWSCSSYYCDYTKRILLWLRRAQGVGALREERSCVQQPQLSQGIDRG